MFSNISNILTFLLNNIKLTGKYSIICNFVMLLPESRGFFNFLTCKKSVKNFK